MDVVGELKDPHELELPHEAQLVPKPVKKQNRRRSSGRKRGHPEKGQGGKQKRKSQTLPPDLGGLQQILFDVPTTSPNAPNPVTAGGEAYHRQRYVVFGLAVFVVITVGFLVAALVLRRIHTDHVCVTNACAVYSEMLSQSINTEANPCDDLYSYVCDGWTRQERLSVFDTIYKRFLESVTNLAKTRNVPRRGQTAAEKAAKFYQACINTTESGKDQTKSLKRSFQGCGIRWPIEDPSSDVLDIIFCVSAGWLSPPLLFVKRVGETAFLVEPSQYYTETLRRRDALLKVGKYAEYYRIMCDNFIDSKQACLGYSNLAKIEEIIVNPLRNALNLKDKGTLKNLNLGRVGALTEPHLPTSRWERAVTKQYNISSVTSLKFTISNIHFFRTFFNLTKQLGETKMAYYVGWTMTQRLALLLNNGAIYDLYHLTSEGADQWHQQFCVDMAHNFVGLAFYSDYAILMATSAVLDDVSNLTRNIRHFFHAAITAAPWFRINVSILSNKSAVDSSLSLIQQLIEPEGLKATYANFPDMTDTLLANVRLINSANQTILAASRTSSIDDDGAIRSYEITSGLYLLFPIALEMPLYGVEMPKRLKYAGLGSEVASAIATIVFDNWLLWDTKTRNELLLRTACFFGKPLAANELKWEHWDLLIRVLALRVLWVTVQSVVSTDAPVVLRGLQHLSEQQLFFVVWCFMTCGELDGRDRCNRPLRQVSAFAKTFGCSSDSAMSAPTECPLF